jgi:hypothetical protein
MRRIALDTIGPLEISHQFRYILVIIDTFTRYVELTEYVVGDNVLRRYPTTKIGYANPNKYGSWWRGPYLVTAVSKVPIIYGFEKLWYTIQNLVPTKEYFADVTHLKPFYFDPDYVTPLNIATRDTDESVVLRILDHDFSDTTDKRWLVEWFGADSPHTWERHATLKNVEAFHQYCATHQLNAFLPKDHPEFSASKPSTQRRAPGQFAVPVEPKEITTEPELPKKKRGRPPKNKVIIAATGVNMDTSCDSPIEELRAASASTILILCLKLCC